MSKTLLIAAGTIASIVVAASALDPLNAAVPSTKAPTAKPTAKAPATMTSIQRGKYLLMLGGCNDCHTPGFDQSAGTTPESEWLVGSSMGFKGPWGTTYPINLRTFINNLTEDEWVQQARTLKGAPPMPWWALHNMQETDLRSIYAFVKNLGPKGTEAPAYVPPTEQPKTPYVVFEPVFPK